MIDYQSATDQRAYIDFYVDETYTSRWWMRRFPQPAKNQDVWRLDEVNLILTADRGLTNPTSQQQMVTGFSEQEPVIKEVDAPDSCGGYQHGYDKLSSITCTVYYYDATSEVVDLTSSGYVNPSKRAERVEFSQTETYYEHGTTTPWFNATKVWKFSGYNQVEQTTTMTAVRTANINTFYTAMFTPKYTLVNEGRRLNASGAYDYVDLSANPVAFNEISGATAEAASDVYSYDSNRLYKIQVECLEGFGAQQDPANTTYNNANTRHFWIDTVNKPKSYHRQGYTAINSGASLSFKNRYSIAYKS